MTYRRDLFYEIVASADFQAAMVGPMIDDFVQKMKRPGADGATYRAFIECQSAFNRDPLSARKRDPVSVA